MIHVPGGAYDPEWAELDRKLRDGDGLNWAGDPDLWLGIGVIEEARRNGVKTGKTARRLEVWRSCEDGQERMLGSWNPAESFRVLFDLAQMRGGAYGRIDSVESRIDANNDKIEKYASDLYVETMSDMLEHRLRVEHAANNPRTKFFMGGRDAARP